VTVIGGGIAGLAAAWELRRAAASRDLTLELDLLEAGPRLGGCIATERRDGFLIEVGPDSFVTRKPAAVELATAVGLGERLVPTRPEHERVWLLRRGRLVELPPGLGVVPCRLAPVFASSLLSWRGKLRLSLDLVLPRRRRTGDESLAAFLARRFGREALQAYAGPLVAGIYSADPAVLSLEATFPHFAEIERRRGSLIRAFRAADRRGRGDGGGSPTAARVAPAGGMEELVTALVTALGAGAGPGGARLATASPALALRPAERRGGGRAPGWWVELAGGGRLAADAVVLALPAPAAAALVAPLAAAAGTALRAVRYASTATVTLAYREAALGRPLDGYGFVVPAAERRPVTACTFSSAKFPRRAPPGHALVRLFLGGPGRGDLLAHEDAELVALARQELASIWGPSAPPLFAVVHRHERGTPQLEVGHRERMAAVVAALPPGLLLAGAAYDGVGVPDSIASGRRAAARALAAVA
jgi:oxygen-dependent protoporphyrinogen oxidase